MTDPLVNLERAATRRDAAIERANAEFNAAVLAAYREKRDDGTPRFTLAEIGRALGVSRQRVYQLVREASAQEP